MNLFWACTNCAFGNMIDFNMEHDDTVSDDGSDEDDQKPKPSEDIRKSGRKKRPPASYSPDRTEIKRRRVLKKNPLNSPIRKCDLLPNGNAADIKINFKIM